MNISKFHKVVIITVYYNRESEVSTSIESLLDQSFEDFLIIAVNDGSTDSTLEQLKEYENNRKIAILDKKNTGFVDSISRAIESTSSDYIAIHGSGDISYRKRIEMQACVLDEYINVGVVGCHYKNTDLTRGISKNFDNLEGLISGDSIKKKLMMKNPLTQGEVMIRRTAYQQVGGYNKFFTFSQDYDLWIRLSKLTDFYFVPEMLYERFIRSDGVSGNINKIALQQYLASLARCGADFNRSDKLNIVDFLNKRGDRVLKFRLLKLTIRAAFFHKGYPRTLAKINNIEFGWLSLLINSILSLCSLRGVICALSKK